VTRVNRLNEPGHKTRKRLRKRFKELELGRQIMREHRETLEALAKEGHGEKEPA
jgi:hypothetical protein